MNDPIRSQDGLRSLAISVIRHGRRTLLNYESSEDCEFWCNVIGVDPQLVRARCAAK